MRRHDKVTSANLLSPQRVQLVREDYPPIVVGTMSVERVDEAALSMLLSDPSPLSFVVNIPKESYVAGDALRRAKVNGFAIGGLGDLMRAVSLPNVGQYMSPEFTFVERGLTQHSRIQSYDRLDDRCYLLNRKGLDSLKVVFLNEYELTADHLRTARHRYGEFEIAVFTNPNGNSTSSAQSTASAMNIQICKWGDFMSAVNRR